MASNRGRSYIGHLYCVCCAVRDTAVFPSYFAGQDKGRASYKNTYYPKRRSCRSYTKHHESGGAYATCRIETILAPTSRIVSIRLSFRTERSRAAYLDGLERKMSSAGLEWEAAREFVPGKRGAGDGYQLSCGTFKMHVLEHER